MIPKNTKEILNEFRNSRGQKEEPTKAEKPTRKHRKPRTPYDVFLSKYSDLDNTIDSFSIQDLVFYFRKIAEDNSYKFVVQNIKKDLAIMKRVVNNYSNREICAMIEFLYESEQDYLQKDRLSVNLLNSGWTNSIYADMKLWVEDKYVPNSKKHKKNNYNTKGEWNPNTDIENKGTSAKRNIEEDIAIGISFKN